LDEPFYIEYPLDPDTQLRMTELQALAELVIGGPVFLRLSDRQVVGSVSAVAIRDKNTLLLKIKFSDAELAQNINNRDYVNEHYQFLNPVDLVLWEPH